MNRPIYILLWALVLIMLSCQRDEATDKFVLVEPFNEKYLEDSIKYIPYDYYLGNNIILPEGTGDIFYHDTELSCGTGWKLSDPPMPIDFERNPLLKFNSVDAFATFFKSKTSSTTKLVMFVSDSDTIRNETYFDLVNILGKVKDTYVVARRKITEDERDAIEHSRVVNIDR